MDWASDHSMQWNLKVVFGSWFGQRIWKGKRYISHNFPISLSKSLPKSINQTQPKHLGIEITLRTSLHPEKKTATKFLKSDMGIDRKAWKKKKSVIESWIYVLPLQWVHNNEVEFHNTFLQPFGTINLNPTFQQVKHPANDIWFWVSLQHYCSYDSTYNKNSYATRMFHME